MITTTPTLDKTSYLGSSRPGFLHNTLASAIPYGVTAVLCAILVACLFRPWKIDLKVPFDDDGDAHLQQMVIKNFVEGGHFYVNPQLGAPGEQELYDFPLPHWTHVIVWSFLRLFTHDYGEILNLYFFLTFPLSAFAALYALRRFGISDGPAVAGAMLFAILPFHLLRRESHIFLSSLYTLPLAGMVVIWLTTGTPLFGFQLPDDSASRPIVTRDGTIALLSCVLIAWDHPYYAFFTAGFLIVSGLLGQFRSGQRKSLLSAVILCAVITAALLTALAPNIIYFREHGRTDVAKRLPQESERYPLTLIQLIAPVQDHRLPWFAHLRHYYDERGEMLNENRTASLGLLGSIGFFVSLAALFRKRSSEFLYSLGILNLWGVLLGTMGGFGAIYAFLVSPQIRAYDRISVFIGFFSIAALVWAVDRGLRSRRAESGLTGLVLIPAVLIAIGVLDQIPRHLLPPRAPVEAEFHAEQAFIGRVEASVSPRSMIFQLPYMAFPEPGPVNRMAAYHPVVDYLHSRTLRWSYGAMQGRQTDRWLADVSTQPPGQMVRSISDAGFSGILIDRFGYADNAGALEAQLRSLLKSEPLTDSRDRYLFFRLEH